MRIATIYSDIAFGRHRPPITFPSVDGQSLTGSDLTLLGYARELSRRGHDVHLFADRAESCMWGDVQVHPFAEWESWASPHPRYAFDVAFSLSNPNCLEPCDGRRTLRICDRQVASFGTDCKPGWQRWVDVVTCPSQTAVDHVRVPGPEFLVLGNGVDLESFPDVPKIPGRCVWISSADRGLHWVLQEWPKIRAKAPHATLRIYYESIGRWLADYGRDGRASAGAVDDECARRARYIDYGLRRLRAHGVECVLGGISHRDLAKELAQAEALLYPADCIAYTETFGVAVAEAMAAGCLPVLSSADSFGELWNVCPMVDAPVGSRIGEWTGLAIRALTDGAWREERAAAAKAHVARYAWPRLAEELETIIAERVRGPRPTAKHDAPHVELVREAGPTLHAILTKYASGQSAIHPHYPMDASEGGGCRAGFVQLTRGLASIGYRVRAFSTWSSHDTVEGVEHKPLSEATTHGTPDALLAYYDTEPLIHLPARVKVASHHTYSPPNVASIAVADVNVAPSAHSMKALQAKHGGRGWGVLPNIVPRGLPKAAPVKGRVLYHTSADRGLPELVKAWPAIRRQVPHATLHIVGTTEEWAKAQATVPNYPLGDRMRDLLEALGPAREAGGVTMLGKLSRGGVNRELREAACFPFPFNAHGPCETWSTSIAESLSVGVPVALAPGDALGELWGDVVLQVPTPVREHVPELAQAIVRALTLDDMERDAIVGRGRAKVAPFTEENAARALDAMLRPMLAERARAAE